jgi:hypothetical protein
MFEQINYIFFTISFCIGILLVYMMSPVPQIVQKFPSPDNVRHTIYKDKADNCYKYSASEVDCDSEAIDQPIIEDFKRHKI